MFSFFSPPGTTQAQPPRMTLEHDSRAPHMSAGCKNQPKIISCPSPARYGIARADARLHMIPRGHRLCWMHLMHTTLRLLAVPGLVLCSLVIAQCGGTGAGTAPSSSSTPSTGTPSPGGSGTPAPPATGSSLTITPSSIQGQGQPQATVTLASAAPDGGALVVMATSNSTVARVPATVTVAAGSRSTTFLVDTSTVLAATPVTMTASYAGSTMASTLTVLPPALSAAFVVRSPVKGLGACVMEESTQELDCLLDGSASQGFVDGWIWKYTVGTSTLGHTSKDPGSHPQISTKCTFLNTGTGGDGPNGDRFLNMEVTLQVQDRAGVQSGVVRQSVRLYPNRQCGFTY
jgi:hypothetical protein